MDIPNDPMKEDFRKKFLSQGRNWRIRRMAESGQVKRAEQVERDPNIPECVVLSEDEELKAWESASEVDGMEQCEGNDTPTLN